ncbi:MAG: hypothetical protein AB7R40_24840 [Nitrospiraceae bacterium]
MSKRPAIDLSELTSEAAAPMPEASQRMPRIVSSPPPPPPAAAPAPVAEPARTRTENLEALAFKVSPAFRKRFKARALEADLKLNELLFEALDAWEEKRGLRK